MNRATMFYVSYIGKNFEFRKNSLFKSEEKTKLNLKEWKLLIEKGEKGKKENKKESTHNRFFLILDT